MMMVCACDGVCYAYMTKFLTLSKLACQHWTTQTNACLGLATHFPRSASLVRPRSPHLVTLNQNLRGPS